MRKQRKLSPGQKRLKELLEERERTGRTIARREILSATGWAESTLTTYLKKGYLSSHLQDIDEERFKVVGVLGMSDHEFHSSITQTRTLREVGAVCRSDLARNLVRSSKQNMLLALEMFNRLSADNRLDAFVIMAVTAWEQLLKAALIKKNGESDIFRPMKPGRPRETISLRECLEKTFDGNSPIRKNLEEIQFLRDQAIHLLVPEVSPVLSRVFQATVFNFGKFFEEFCGTPFISRSSVGMLVLMGDPRPPTVAHLTTKYGVDIGKEILAMCQTIEAEMRKVDDVGYAIPIEYSLVFARSGSDGEITLSRAESSGLEALVVTKPIDHEKTHPYLTTEAAGLVETMLREQLSPEEFHSRLKKEHASARQPRFTTYDFLAVVYKEKWRNGSRNRYYHFTSRPEIHRYSSEAITFIVDKVRRDPEYLQLARRAYSKWRKTIKTKNK